MALFSLLFINSIHNTTGILFGSQLFLEDFGKICTIKETTWTILEENLERKRWMIGTTSLKTRFEREQVSSTTTMTALFSLLFINSIHNTTGILFDLPKFLEVIGKTWTTKETTWTTLEENSE